MSYGPRDRATPARIVLAAPCFSRLPHRDSVSGPFICAVRVRPGARRPRILRTDGGLISVKFNHRGEPRADFSYSTQGNVVAVVDKGEGRSVTNDAEHVIACLATNFDLAKCRVIYRDTGGIWDELCTRDGRFLTFRSIDERDLKAPLAKAAATPTAELTPRREKATAARTTASVSSIPCPLFLQPGSLFGAGKACSSSRRLRTEPRSARSPSPGGPERSGGPRSG